MGEVDSLTGINPRGQVGPKIGRRGDGRIPPRGGCPVTAGSRGGEAHRIRITTVAARMTAHGTMEAA